MRNFASQYDINWKGYKTKTEDLLARDLTKEVKQYGAEWRPIDRDGEWYKLGQIYNVGGKFLRWMVENDVLDRRRSGTSVESLKTDWYRVRPEWYRVRPTVEWYQSDDFGDLWVRD